MLCTVKKTLKRINDKHGYYIVGVKGNQPKLLNSISSISELSKNKIEFLNQKEKSRGRTEIRRYELYRNTDKSTKSEWAGLNLIIKVYRTRKIKGRISKETAYFITNKSASLKELSTGIRGHWLIENSLHWVKDVTFEEDRTIHKNCKLSEIKSIIINIAMNALRKNEQGYLKKTMRLCCNDINKLLTFLE
jgi:predicted transposase YbfD/YdcC